MPTRSSWHERCWRIPSTPSTYSDIYGLRQEQTELLLATAGALWGAPGDRRAGPAAGGVGIAGEVGLDGVGHVLLVHHVADLPARPVFGEPDGIAVAG